MKKFSLDSQLAGMRRGGQPQRKKSDLWKEAQAIEIQITPPPLPEEDCTSPLSKVYIAHPLLLPNLLLAEHCNWDARFSIQEKKVAFRLQFGQLRVLQQGFFLLTPDTSGPSPSPAPRLVRAQHSAPFLQRGMQWLLQI